MTIKQDTICINTTAFYALLDEVIAYIDLKFKLAPDAQWIDGDAAMKLLNISSRTTLQSLRDQGKIRYSQTSKKNILFDRASILSFIESGSKKTF
jgi:hypothetical protein